MRLSSPSLFLLGCLTAPLAACASDGEAALAGLDEPMAGAPADVAAPPAPAPAANDDGIVRRPGELPELSTRTRCGGTWDALPVEQYAGAAGAPEPFVDFHESRVGFHVNVGCSGTLISDDLFISAGHCGYLVGDTVRFDYQVSPTGAPRPVRDFTVAQVVEQEHNATWDYAIVRLAGSPGREFGHANLAAIDPPVSSVVTLIGHPSTRAKEIHAGPVADYASPLGANWFRYWVDTEPGNSGSGILDAQGRLVGVHTNGGCTATWPFNGNSGMRMSQLVPHSPTLSALTRHKVLWRYLDSPYTSLWNVAASGARLGATDYNPAAGWSALTYSNNRMVWRHTDGRISYWVLNDAGAALSYLESSAGAGWSAVSAANDRVLWRRAADGQIQLWKVSANGAYVSSVTHSVAPGWTPVNYANNHVLWRHTDGRISLWRVDDNNNYLSYADYNPGPGWTPLGYENGQITWRHSDGRVSTWNLSRDNTLLSSTVAGPFPGWTPLMASDRKLAWRASNTFSLWNTDGDGAFLSDAVHGVDNNWSVISIAGARP